MSHYWEMLFGQQGLRPAPHGIQVGVGTVLILKVVETFLAAAPDFAAARTAAAKYDQAAWEASMETAYGPAAPGIIQMERTAHKNDTDGRLSRIDAMERNWSAIDTLLRRLPSSAYVETLLRELGSPSRPEEIGVDKVLLKDTLLYCKEVRPRYTILQMLWDLGVLEDVAGRVIAAL